MNHIISIVALSIENKLECIKDKIEINLKEKIRLKISSKGKTCLYSIGQRESLSLPQTWFMS